MYYGVKIIELSTGKFEASCRDIPECIYEADTYQEALDLAGQMLPGTLVLKYKNKKKPFPMPSEVTSDEVRVKVPVKVQAKMLLWNFIQANGLRLIDVSRMLGITPAQAGRLVDLTNDHASVDKVERALDALGGVFNLSIDERKKN